MVHLRQFSKATWGSACFTVFFSLALSLTTGGTASAQIPSKQGVFFACVRLDKDQDEAHLARLVAPDEACKRNETRVQWSVTGPQGPQGQQGIQGPQGNQGATGGQGAIGATGPMGPSGAIGPTGAAGATGATGATGAKGDAGAPGAQGISVAVETVGLNAPDCSGLGGLKVTLVDGQGTTVGGPQFVCNGAAGAPGAIGPTGPAGTTGQAVFETLSTATASVTGASCITSASVVVPVATNNEVLLVADGGIQTTSGLTTGFSVVDVFVALDNVASSAFGVRRVYASNNGGAVQQTASWSMSRKFSNLTAGAHTFAVCGTLAAGSNANLGGDQSSGRQTSLTVVILNK